MPETAPKSPLEPMTFTGSGGVRLVGDAVGPSDGPPVVLLHGGGQTRHSWHGTAHVLAGRGWRVYAVDLRGHGDSDWPDDGDYTLEAFARDVQEVATSLDERPALVGASLGGISSLTAIADAPEPIATALVLVDVAPRMERSGVQRIGEFMTAHLDGFASLDEVADAIAAYNPQRPRPRDLSGLVKIVRRRDDGRYVWHWDPRFVRGKFGSADETRASITEPNRLQRAARSLTIPTLLVRGHQSDLLSEEGARELQELVPHAQYVDVAGAGHMVAGDRNDAFNDAVVAFLDALRT